MPHPLPYPHKPIQESYSFSAMLLPCMNSSR